LRARICIMELDSRACDTHSKSGQISLQLNCSYHVNLLADSC
jgi:hypothetical protein